MQNFKTSPRHIIIQGILLISLIFFTLQNRNLDGVMRMPILLIVDAIAVSFFLSSIIRRVTLSDSIITVKTFFRTSSVSLDSIEYVQGLSALARWVIILNDGKHTVIMTSLINGLDKIAEVIKQKLPEDEKDKLIAVTNKSIASKKRTYDLLLIVLTLIVWFGIARNIF